MTSLEILSQVVGWAYFACWSLSFYPQVIENYRRKSVIGLSFDFLFFNITGYLCYTVFNSALFWDPLVQSQYEIKYDTTTNPVHANDIKSTIGWSIGNVLLDFSGGILSFVQMIIDSVIIDNWSKIFVGDPVKLGLSLISIGFDLLFMVQHYILYRKNTNRFYQSIQVVDDEITTTDEEKNLIK
eukprot:gene8470-10403_t